MEQEPDFITIQQVSEITGLSRSTLSQMRWHNTGPRWYQLSPRKHLYRRSDVLAWIEEKASRQIA